MSIFRCVFLAIATVMLSLTLACSQTTIDDSSIQLPSAVLIATTTDNYSGKTKININAAILPELDKLEAKLGVPALSDRIQASRPYSSTEELVKKNVVTQEQFDKIKDTITIEEVVLTGVARDVDYMTKLGLMKGHLVVAKELLALHQPQKAEPHIGHPVEEIYIDMEDQLNERNVKEFKTTLINLQDLVKSKPDDAKVKSDLVASMESIDAAIAVLPADQRSRPEFVLKVISGLLEAAASEYGAAITNGKVAAAIEYQDSYGFVSYVNSLYEGISLAMAEGNPEAHKTIEASMSELTKVWPSALPPTAPVKTPEQVAQMVQTIEQNSQLVILRTRGTPMAFAGAPIP